MASIFWALKIRFWTNPTKTVMNSRCGYYSSLELVFLDDMQSISRIADHKQYFSGI